MLVEIDNRSLKSEHKRVGKCNSKKKEYNRKKRADIKKSITPALEALK